MINDAAEREVTCKLIEEYNNILTKNCDQKQFLLQVVTTENSFRQLKRNNVQKIGIGNNLYLYNLGYEFSVFCLIDIVILKLRTIVNSYVKVLFCKLSSFL